MVVDDEPDVFVTSVRFADGLVSIEYAELRKQSNVAGIMEAMTIDAAVVSDEIDEVQSLLRDLIDAGHVLISHPPKSTRRTYDEDEDLDDDGDPD